MYVVRSCNMYMNDLPDMYTYVAMLKGQGQYIRTRKITNAHVTTVMYYFTFQMTFPWPHSIYIETC